MAGCCNSARPINESVVFDHVGTPLAPKKITANNRSTSFVVDPHCHIFNATDLQVAGFLRGPVAYELDEPFRTIVQRLASIVEFIAKHIAISATAEYERLNRNLEQGVLDDPGKLADEIRRHREDVAERLLREIRKSDLGDQIETQIQAEAVIMGRGSGAQLDTEYLLRAFDQGSDTTGEQDAVSLYRAQKFSMAGVFAFVGFLLSPRYHNLISYRTGYSTANDAIGINQCYAALVDFDFWIGDCDYTRSRVRDQIILMQRISELAGDYMTPLAPYNPWTDINDGDESLSLVMDAIDNRGFAGVKIYPPMGFFPAGNADNVEYPTSAPHPPLDELDRKLGMLFDFCNSRCVPVMSHSNESLGRKPDHDILGGPIGWRTLYENERFDGVRANLAHIGGSKNRTAESENWTAQFVNIMKLPAAKHLYGDFGFWDDVVSGDLDAVRRIIDLLDVRLNEEETASDRMMFGTDWLMLSQNGLWSSYPKLFLAALEDCGIQDSTLNKIFYENAQNLFDRSSC